MLWALAPPPPPAGSRRHGGGLVVRVVMRVMRGEVGDAAVLRTFLWSSLAAAAVDVGLLISAAVRMEDDIGAAPLGIAIPGLLPVGVLGLVAAYLRKGKRHPITPVELSARARMSARGWERHFQRVLASGRRGSPKGVRARSPRRRR